MEFISVTLLLGKIIAMDSFEDLSEDELHLLAKIIKVKKKQIEDFQ